MYFRKPFSFEGRISRGEYFLSDVIFFVYSFLVAMLLLYIDEYLDTNLVDSVFYHIGCIPGYWFYFAQNTKRCHDLGRSGWFQLLPFYFLVMLFAKGDIGETGWGPDPLIEVEEKSDEEIY